LRGNTYSCHYADDKQLKYFHRKGVLGF